MSAWPEVPLAELCNRVTSGGTPNRTVDDYFALDGGGHSWVKSSELRDRYVRSTAERVTDRGLRESAAKLIPADSVLVAMYGATAGRVGLLNIEAAVNQAICALVVDRERAHPVFVFHALRSKYDELAGKAAGAAQQNLNAGIVRSFRIAAPDCATQRRVAAVLSAFDELIEINEARIELLEALARLLYREWFVRFRFPGHGRSPSEDALSDELPAGWGIATLGSMAKWLSGGTPSTKNPDYWDGGIPWITSGTLTSLLLSTSERTLTPAGVAAGSRLVERDTLLFVVRGMSLVREFRVGIAERSLAFGQDCKALIAIDGVNPLYLAFSVLDRQHDIQRMVELAGHGTGKLSTDRLKAVEIPLPPQAIQMKFEGAVRPIRELISVATASARRLADTRDLLLPRLVTGRLDVSDVDLGSLLPMEEA